jgi:hypothetical protein
MKTHRTLVDLTVGSRGTMNVVTNKLTQKGVVVEEEGGGCGEGKEEGEEQDAG